MRYTYDYMERPLATYVSRDGGPERLLCGTGYDALRRVASSQPYKYTGKELDRETGLDWYDSQARMLDPTTGRTTTKTVTSKTVLNLHSVAGGGYAVSLVPIN